MACSQRRRSPVLSKILHLHQVADLVGCAPGKAPALGGYIFNLKTTGLTTGTYHLKFTVNGLGDYTAAFAVK
jgi:hypothetical protein